MKKFLKKIKFLPEEGRLQDLFILGGLFVFVAILIIGLFPGTKTMDVKNQEFFLYAVMTVPLIAALYFIVVSLRRNIYSGESLSASSIRYKMAMAFVFVALLSSLPVVLASNYILNQTLSGIIIEKTTGALGEAVVISKEPVELMRQTLQGELEAVRYQLDAGTSTLLSYDGRVFLRNMYQRKGIAMLTYAARFEERRNTLLLLDGGNEDIRGPITDFFSSTRFEGDTRVDRLTMGGQEYLAASLRYHEHLLVLYRMIPSDIAKRTAILEQSLADHRRLARSIGELKSDAGLYLLGLTMFIVIVSVAVSLYLSTNITRPVLELATAARELSRGNFDLALYRESNDELGLLFRSFNRMVYELNRNRRIIYQKQRLEAWREMARRVVHEIKNPLTPIRLSAERIRKRFLENHPDIRNVILTGTETIIDEVGVLMNILAEFTEFARLPEMKPVRADINILIESCVNLFSGHEEIRFHATLDPRIPEIYIDKMLIKQVLNNLIQNAVDAVAGKGNIYVKSELVPDDAPDMVRISIRDDGIGIRDFDKDKIFNPGFSTKTTGTGLGLAIVQKIIMEHRGEITCDSEYGKGTEFVIELPIDTQEGSGYG